MLRFRRFAVRMQSKPCLRRSRNTRQEAPLATPLLRGAFRPARASVGADGQKSERTQLSQRGERALQVARPCKISRRLNAPRSEAGIMRLRTVSTRTGSVWSVRPRRSDSRCTWVSTGRPGNPKATLRTTFAVLRPDRKSVLQGKRGDLG